MTLFGKKFVGDFHVQGKVLDMLKSIPFLSSEVAFSQRMYA